MKLKIRILLISLFCICAWCISYAEPVGIQKKISIIPISREKQSNNMDSSSYIYYCFLAASKLADNMSIMEFEYLMEEQYIYYLDSEETQVDGLLGVRYRFTPYLSLCVYNNPIEKVQMHMTCPEHEEAYVTITLSSKFTTGNLEQGNLELREFFEPNFPHRLWNKENDMKQLRTEWMEHWNIEGCLDQPHSTQGLTVPLMQYLLKASAFYTGMPIETVELVNELFPIYYEGESGGFEHPYYRSVSCRAEDLYTGSAVEFEFIFDEKQLNFERLSMEPPNSEDLFTHEIADGSSRQPNILYHEYRELPVIYIDLSDTWMTRRTGYQ